jgi:hypothetical protein
VFIKECYYQHQTSSIESLERGPTAKSDVWAQDNAA